MIAHRGPRHSRCFAPAGGSCLHHGSPVGISHPMEEGAYVGNSDSPAFQFYPADYLTDTEWMTSEEEGVYMRLLCHCWRGSAPGCKQGQLPERHRPTSVG